MAGETSAAVAPRRIPRFAERLRTALSEAGLPVGVDPWVDPPSYSPDPLVTLQWQYTPGRYAKAFVRTDAHDRRHLDPVWIVEQAVTNLEEQARDRRFSEAARKASGDFAVLLRQWND